MQEITRVNQHLDKPPSRTRFLPSEGGRLLSGQSTVRWYLLVPRGSSHHHRSTCHLQQKEWKLSMLMIFFHSLLLYFPQGDWVFWELQKLTLKYRSRWKLPPGNLRVYNLRIKINHLSHHLFILLFITIKLKSWSNVLFY